MEFSNQYFSNLSNLIFINRFFGKIPFSTSTPNKSSKSFETDVVTLSWNSDTVIFSISDSIPTTYSWATFNKDSAFEISPDCLIYACIYMYIYEKEYEV